MLKTTIQEYDRVTVIRLVGEFYLSSIKDVEIVWEQVLQRKPGVIGIDCKKLDFIDSSAIGTMVKFLNKSAEKDVRMIFLDLSPSVVRLFDTAKLDRVFSITSWKEFMKMYIPEPGPVDKP